MVTMDDYIKSQMFGCLDAYFFKRISRTVEMSFVFQTDELYDPIRAKFIKMHNGLHKNQ